MLRQIDDELCQPFVLAQFHPPHPHQEKWRVAHLQWMGSEPKISLELHSWHKSLLYLSRYRLSHSITGHLFYWTKTAAAAVTQFGLNPLFLSGRHHFTLSSVCSCLHQFDKMAAAAEREKSLPVQVSIERTSGGGGRIREKKKKPKWSNSGNIGRWEPQWGKGERHCNSRRPGIYFQQPTRTIRRSGLW